MRLFIPIQLKTDNYYAGKYKTFKERIRWGILVIFYPFKHLEIHLAQTSINGYKRWYLATNKRIV